MPAITWFRTRQGLCGDGAPASQSIDTSEIASRRGDDLTAGRMVGTLDADHLRRRDGRVILHVLRQLELGRGGPDNQNGVDCVELPYDLSEEPMGVIRMLPWLTAPFRMRVEVVLGRQNRSFIGRIR